jgi:16S rRNA (guanine966-N2)-methyltransferase
LTVRVISGLARGRSLRAAPQTRPTADLIKGAIFSMLEALAYKRGFEPDEDGNFAASLAWPRVLDLFAGSGALGIEALSRGAQYAEFVDQDRDAARIIEANLRATDYANLARVHLAPVELALARVAGPFDVVLADPPYDDTHALTTVAKLLAREGLVVPTSVAVVEHGATTEAPEHLGLLPLAGSRKHGRTRISLYAIPAV